jgi:hypothetical protein
MVKDGVTRSVRFSEAAIDKVVAWCSAHGRMRYGDVLVKRLGSMPVGMEGTALMKREVFLYNPDDLPGLHEIGPDPFTVTKNGAAVAVPCLINAIELEINGQQYVIAIDGLTDAYEEVTDPSKVAPT